MMYGISQLFARTSTPARKAAVISSIAIIVVLIVDFLASRQMFPYDNFSGSVIFSINIVVAYGIGSYFILRYVGKASQDIRKKSRYLDVLFKATVLVQAALATLLAAMLVEFYYNDNSVRYMTYSVFALSTNAAAAIMGMTCFKFFQWYRVLAMEKRNYLILLCGLAAGFIATAMIFDAGAKLLLVRVVEEESPDGAVSQDTFIYKPDERYQGEVQYKVVKGDTTTLYIVPSAIRLIYHYVNGWIPITIAFGFTWAITAILLRRFYQKKGRLPIILFALLVLPLVLFMVGRTPDFYSAFTGQIWRWDDFQNPYLLKSIFRAGVIGGSIAFGVGFLVVSRAVGMQNKLRDYMTIAAIGATIIGISLAPSAQQQTFGVAGRSLMLLASFLFSFGFYLSAVTLAHDDRLRRSIGKLTGSQILNSVGAAQLEYEVGKVVIEVAAKESEALSRQTGIQPTLDDDLRKYLDEVSREVQMFESKGKTNVGVAA
jgi:hypothetical protein